MVGILAGLAVLVGWVGYVALATPAMPDLQKASAADVVAYVSSPRGLAALPQIQQEQFLQRWREQLADEGARRKLSEYLSNLPEDQRRPFGEAMFEHIKKVFLDDARRFSQLKAEEKNAFLRKKIVEYRDQVLAMKEVAAGFKGMIGSRPDDAQQYIVEHSTPKERALGEPYADALKRVREQVKKEERVSNAGS